MLTGEIDLESLAKDTEELGSGMFALAQLIKGTNEMEYKGDWNVLIDSIGSLALILSDYADHLASRGRTIEQNLKTLHGGDNGLYHPSKQKTDQAEPVAKAA